MIRILLLALLVIGIAAPATGAENTGSFYALFYDGSHLSVPAFHEDVWWSDKATLGGHRLFGTENPVRILQDMAPRAALLGPRVEMANGDVVPGKIVGFLPAAPRDDTPARLLIALDGSLLAADPRGLAVRADRVLRVTSAAGGTSAGEPGSLMLTRGIRLTTSAIRWSDQGLKALTRSGLTTVPFDAIGDFCVPRLDVTRAVLDDSFYPPLGPAAVIGRLETVSGAVLTYFREMTLTGASKALRSSRYLLVQPSWSLGTILVPIDSIWRQSFRAAKEVPLSLLPAKTLREKVGFHRWPWRRNENVEGGMLAIGTIAVDLGVGTHPCCAIGFELPPQAKEFITLVGLDRSIGPGACATCKVYADQLAGKPLFSSGLLRSGQGPLPVGPLPVAGCRTLVLVTEWAGEDRPREAYPLDIGGHVDWLMPLVTVEADADSYCQSLRRFVPGWATWDLALADACRVRVWPRWDAEHECWLPVVYPTGEQPLTLRRTLAPVSSANDLVELVFGQVKDAPWPKIDLRVDGALLAPTLGQHEDQSAAMPEQPAKPKSKPDAQARKLKPDGAPARGSARKLVVPNGHEPQTVAGDRLSEAGQPYWVRTMQWDLRRFHGRPVQLTLSISPQKLESGLVWRALTTTAATGNSPPRSKR